MEISNKSRKNSTIESPTLNNMPSVPAASKRGPESDLEINSDSADTLANPRKRRRLQRGLRDRQKDQPPTLNPSRSGSLPNHNDEKLLKKFIETAKRRPFANGRVLSPTMEDFARPLDAPMEKLDSSSVNGPKSREPTHEAEIANIQQPAAEEDQNSNAESAPASELQANSRTLEHPIPESSNDNSQSQAAKQSEVSNEAMSTPSRDETTFNVDMNYNFSHEPNTSVAQSRSDQVSQVEPQETVAQIRHPLSDEGADDVEGPGIPNRESSIDPGGNIPGSEDSLGTSSNMFTDDRVSRPEEDSAFRIRQENSSSSAEFQRSMHQIGGTASEAQMQGWHVSITPFGQEGIPPLANATSTTNMLLAEALNPAPQNTEPDTSIRASTAQLPPQDLSPNPAAEEADESRPTSSGGKPKPKDTYIQEMIEYSRKNSLAPTLDGQPPGSPVSTFSTQESDTRPTSGWTAINASPQSRKPDAVSQPSPKRNSGASAPSKKRSFKGPDISELKVIAPAPASSSNSTSPRNANNPRNKRHRSASKYQASSQTSLPQPTPAVQQSSAAVQEFPRGQPGTLLHTSTPPQTPITLDVQVAASPSQTQPSLAQLLTQPHEQRSSANSEEWAPRSNSLTDTTHNNSTLYNRNLATEDRSNQEPSRVHDSPAIGQQRLDGPPQMLGPNRSPEFTTRVVGNPNPGSLVRYPWVQRQRAGSPLRHSLSAQAHGASAHAAMQPNQQAYRPHDAHSHSANVSPTTHLPQLEHDAIFQRHSMDVPPPPVHLNRPFTGQDLRRGSAPAHNPAAAPNFPQPAHQVPGEGNVSAQGPHGHPPPVHKSTMPSSYPFLHQRKTSSSQGQPPSQVYSGQHVEEEAMRRACGTSNASEDSLFYRNPFESLTQPSRKRSYPDTAAAKNPSDEAQPKPAKKPRKVAARKSHAGQETKQQVSSAAPGGSEALQTAPSSQPSFSIDSTKIRLYVRPSPAYEAMRLGPAKSCGEFVDTILKRVDVPLQHMHIIKVSFSWMSEGQNGRSLWMRRRDDADAFGEIVDELQGRLRQAPQESPRLDVELYLKG